MWCAGGPIPIPIPHSFLGQMDGCDLNNIQLGRGDVTGWIRGTDDDAQVAAVNGRGLEK